ncbi:hypothetical protein [Micromonospora sp. DT41]|uniref:hypothetical protein n=1 Tax=Micromonospora sp. DT41 TaxID=3393437 RepID=UPI003CEDDA7E
MPEQKRATNPHVERLALKIVEDDLRLIGGIASTRSPELANKWSDASTFVDRKQRELDRGGPPPPGGMRRRDRDPDQDLDPTEVQWQPEPVVRQDWDAIIGRLIQELRHMLDGTSDATAAYPTSQGPPHATRGPWPTGSGPWPAGSEPWPAGQPPVPSGTPFGLPLHDLPLGSRPTSEFDEAVLRSQLTDAVESMLKENHALSELYKQVDLPTVSHFLKGRGVEPEGAEARLDRAPAEPTIANMAALVSPDGGRTLSSQREPETPMARAAAVRSSPELTPSTRPVSPVSRRRSSSVASRGPTRG